MWDACRDAGGSTLGPPAANPSADGGRVPVLPVGSIGLELSGGVLPCLESAGDGLGRHFAVVRGQRRDGGGQQSRGITESRIPQTISLDDSRSSSILPLTWALPPEGPPKLC